jgi:hypothetical protein
MRFSCDEDHPRGIAKELNKFMSISRRYLNLCKLPSIEMKNYV